jgi:hypothetical protein
MSRTAGATRLRHVKSYRPLTIVEAGSVLCTPSRAGGTIRCP